MAKNLTTVVSSADQVVEISRDRPTVIIGERINPTGRKLVLAALQEGDFNLIRQDAVRQVEAGAPILDVNAGVPGADEPALLVDVGTNAEVVLGNSQWLIACAGAAGPALESGVTRMGTLAAPGVIDRVRLDRTAKRFKIHTIADQPPHGICGSGLIDLAAQLFLSGLIDFRGRFQARACGDRLIEIDGTEHLIVVPSTDSATGKALTISQTDLDSLIRSKAAMYTILETITGTVGIQLEDIATFYVAGTFGTFIQPTSAIGIGMLPDLPLKAFKPLGNSSLGGATSLLRSDCSIEEIDRIRDRITYLELNVNQDFMNRFSAAKFLPHTDRSRFPSVRPPVDL